MKISIPYPPSNNTYYRKVNGRMLISADGRAYSDRVGRVVASHIGCPMEGRVTVTIEAWMPDRRRRDIDNLPKALLDALTRAGAWVDDQQIDDLRVWRAGIDKEDPRVEVTITEVPK